MIEKSEVTEQVMRALELMSTIIRPYGGDEPDIHVTPLESEVESGKIHVHSKDGIERVHADDGEVAVDITPRRKFMSAIEFAAGLRFDADHVFYYYS